MKEISIFIPTDDLQQITSILRNHDVGGITFYEINGAGRTKRDSIPEIVQSYRTGRSITPEYAKRIKIELVVSDLKANNIVDDILNNLNKHADNEAHGMIFVKDVSDAIEIGTKQRGESALTRK
jgi:nitrogen regulatory protein P-II 1